MSQNWGNPTTVKLFRCDFVITLLAFKPLLSKAVNRLLRIYNNKLKFSPFWGFLSSPPYFTHDASCIMLNIGWTPLPALTLKLRTDDLMAFDFKNLK